MRLKISYCQLVAKSKLHSHRKFHGQLPQTIATPRQVVNSSTLQKTHKTQQNRHNRGGAATMYPTLQSLPRLYAFDEHSKFILHVSKKSARGHVEELMFGLTCVTVNRVLNH